MHLKKGTQRTSITGSSSNGHECWGFLVVASHMGGRVLSTQAILPCFLGLARSWTGRRVVRTCTGTQIKYQCHNSKLTHNVSPKM